MDANRGCSGIESISGKVLLAVTNKFLDNSHSINCLQSRCPFLCKIQVNELNPQHFFKFDDN